ncbi:MAG: ribosome-associated translation inhibitor RaiA [Ktedonobacteraceae bacterium]
MNIIIKGKQMDVNSRLQQIIERKAQKLSRLVGEAARLEVMVSEEKTRSTHDRFSVQLALTGNTHYIHSEMSAVNANMAFDLALEKIMTQLGRQKDRQTSARRRHTAQVKVLSLSRIGLLTSLTEEEEEDFAEEMAEEQGDAQDGTNISREQNEEIWTRILEIRRLPAWPMDDQAVIAQMEMLGLSFFPFFNEATNSVNVMYRLDTGGYGLLVPEAE